MILFSDFPALCIWTDVVGSGQMAKRLDGSIFAPVKCIEFQTTDQDILPNQVFHIVFFKKMFMIFIRKKNLGDHKVSSSCSGPIKKVLKCDHHRAVIEEPDYLP